MPVTCPQGPDQGGAKLVEIACHRRSSVACLLALQDLALHAAHAMSLLDDVSELVGEEVPSFLRVRLEGASSEEDVVTDGEGFGFDVASELVGRESWWTRTLPKS